MNGVRESFDCSCAVPPTARTDSRRLVGLLHARSDFFDDCCCDLAVFVKPLLGVRVLILQVVQELFVVDIEHPGIRVMVLPSRTLPCVWSLWRSGLRRVV